MHAKQEGEIMAEVIPTLVDAGVTIIVAAAIIKVIQQMGRR
jgi:hypothetical protein